MIPYSLFQCILDLKEGKIFEARALDFSPASFTFRVSKRHRKLAEEVTGVRLIFSDPLRNTRRALCQREYQIRIIREEDYYLIYEYSSKDPAYAEAARELSRSYLDYIDKKLSLEDAQLAAALNPFYPEHGDQEYYPDAESQLKALSKEVLEPFERNQSLEKDYMQRLSDFSLGILLEEDELVSFLELPFSSFLDQYWKRRGLEGHPIRDKCPSAVYLGNSFCPLLLPDPDLVIKLGRKAKREGLDLVLLVGPSGENLYEKRLETLKKLAGVLSAEGIKIRVQANDIGTHAGLKRHEANDTGIYQAMMKDQEEAVKIYEGLLVEEGILLNKKLKDPRRRYLDLKDWTWHNSPDWTYYNGGLIQYDQVENQVYMPFYQTNTGTFCPLHALAKTGDRGRQTRVSKCGKECQTMAVLYPKHLKTIGLYNSIFAFDACGLTRSDFLAYLGEKGIRRLVLNFPPCR